MKWRKMLFVALPLLVVSGVTMGQEKKLLVSADSALKVLSYVQDNPLAMLSYSDSCLFQGAGKQIQIYPPKWHEIHDTTCKDIPEALTSTCQIFVPPAFTSIHELGDNLYAVVGYATQLPATFKHVWIVSLKDKDLKIVKRIAMVTTAKREINFSYHPEGKEILINSRLNGLTGDMIFSFGNKTVLSKEGIEVATRSQNINSNIWRPASENEVDTIEEVIYRIRF